MICIHELPGWPRFTWDSEALAAPLAAVRHEQGKHLGRMQALGFGLSFGILFIKTLPVVKGLLDGFNQIRVDPIGFGRKPKELVRLDWDSV